jgi:hypothetical protein
MSAAGASPSSPPKGQNQDEPLLLVLVVAMLAVVALSELQAASKHAHAAIIRIRIESSL